MRRRGIVVGRCIPDPTPEIPTRCRLVQDSATERYKGVIKRYNVDVTKVYIFGSKRCHRGKVKGTNGESVEVFVAVPPGFGWLLFDAFYPASPVVVFLFLLVRRLLRGVGRLRGFVWIGMRG